MKKGKLQDVLKVFIIGALLVFPIMVLQHAFIVEKMFTSAFSQAFILSGLFEEFFKWFLLYYFVYKHARFNKPYDGIIYGVALSLGFATLENFFYLLANGIEIAWFRAFFPVSSHALFGVIMGYYLGRAKFEQEKNVFYLSISLWFPVCLHGFYNYILLSIELVHWIMLPFMLFLWWFGLQKVKLTNMRQRHFNRGGKKDE